MTIPSENAQAQNVQAQIEGLATLLVLDDEIRRLSNIREFGFFSTNETHRLISYHTAYLWQTKELIGIHLLAQSGTAELDIHAPTNQWLKEKIHQIKAGAFAIEIHQFSREELEPDATTSTWPETVPHYLLWCPLLNKNNNLTGGLVFFRETLFAESEIKMLRWLIASYQYTWRVLTKASKLSLWRLFKKKPYFSFLTFAIIILLIFPIRLSVLGNGTVVPKTPILINSPMEGVIKSFAVNPGTVVTAGELLFTMDQTDLESAADVSQKDYLLTEAKLRTVINLGFNDKNSHAEVPVLQAQLAIDQAHLNYTKELLAKSNVTTPISGIVIFDSKEDWVGQPVHTGERILEVADPKQVRLKITIPVSDSIKLETGASGKFFLYGQFNSLPIRLTILGYNAKLLPNKILAYQLEAEFTQPDDMPQIGAQGTVELYGQHVPLIYYLIRRPLQAIRQTLGI